MKPFKFLSKNLEPIVWRTQDGIMIPVEELGIRHINNIRNCILGVGRRTIPNPYQGRTHSEWLEILRVEEERIVNQYTNEIL